MIRRNIPVTEISSAKSVHELDTFISHVGKVFQLHCNATLIAECVSAKRLADWAFSHGALSVTHDYDLKLSDNEP